MAEVTAALAPRLRRAWFEGIAPALESELPGAWEALAMSSLELTDDGALAARIPSVYPVLKPVQKLVRAAVLEGMGAHVPDLPVTLKFSASTPRTVRRHSTGLDVYHWGDPPPEDWPRLLGGLTSTLATLEEPARSVLSLASIEAISQRVIWFRYPTVEARRAVGTTPGVAYALKVAVDSWRPGTLIVSYATGM